MVWKFTCYNGDVFETDRQMTLKEAIDVFIRFTGMTQYDIRLVENIH